MVTCAGGDLVPAQHDGGRRATAVGVFHLRLHARPTEVELGGMPALRSSETASR
jgi:hypothetical protein